MRLVDADALKEDCRMANDCKDCKTDVRNCEYDRIYTKMDFCGWLDDAPTVDAVPVVRCKDCKHWRDSDGVYRRGVGAKSKCPINLAAVYKGTFYCGFGERKDGDHYG